MILNQTGQARKASKIINDSETNRTSMQSKKDHKGHYSVIIINT